MDNIETNEDKSKRYDQFILIRNKYADFQNEECKKYDNNVFLLSTGIFSITFAFIEKVIKTPIKEYYWLLVVAWCLILLSILLSLFISIVNYYSYNVQMKICDILYKNPKINYRKLIRKNKYVRFEEGLRIINFEILVMGFIIFMLYISVNLLGG
jgi:hypothetical protein